MALGLRASFRHEPPRLRIVPPPESQAGAVSQGVGLPDDGAETAVEVTRRLQPVVGLLEAAAEPGEQAEVPIGRTELGFSPYTAIKRRNPFCLLNPIPLSLSW